MFEPLVVSYRNLSARVVYAPSDGLYHGTWSFGGLRGKTASKDPETAKQNVLEKLKLLHAGRISFATMSEKQAAKAAGALKLLEEHGHTDILRVATDYIAIHEASSGNDPLLAIRAIANQKSEIESIPFSYAANEWFRIKKDGWSEVHRKNTEYRLLRIKKDLNINVCDLTHEILSEYLHQFKGHSPKTRNHFRETFKGVLSFSCDREWMDESVFRKLSRLLKNEPASPKAVEILTPEQFKGLLNLAKSTELLPIVAIGGFTGARIAEILRLDWSSIWGRADHVELEADITKTRRRRLIPRFPALGAWLNSFRNHSGLVWPHSQKAFESRYYRLRDKAGIRGNNLLRHSYASYRFTQIGEDELAKEMGNSPEMIFSNYRELVEPSEAEAWFNIYP